MEQIQRVCFLAIVGVQRHLESHVRTPYQTHHLHHSSTFLPFSVFSFLCCCNPIFSFALKTAHLWRLQNESSAAKIILTLLEYLAGAYANLFTLINSTGTVPLRGTLSGVDSRFKKGNPPPHEITEPLRLFENSSKVMPIFFSSTEKLSLHLRVRLHRELITTRHEQLTTDRC